jgi:hypothetical protein
MTSLPGQGTPTPDFLGCTGDWILKDHLFIYYWGGSNVRGGSAPRFTISAIRTDGQRCIGFDAEQLAAALGTDSATVIAANRDGTLVYLGVATVDPTHGGQTAKAYGFRLGDREVSLTVEINEKEGTT